MSSAPSRRARLADMQDGFCPECGLALPDDLAEAEVDHIIPRVRGGPDKPWNWQLVHFKCNRSKRFKLTSVAVALATEHGVELREPQPAAWREAVRIGAGSRFPSEIQRRAAEILKTYFPRKCHGCGRQLVAATDDPETLVLCGACYPDEPAA